MMKQKIDIKLIEKNLLEGCDFKLGLSKKQMSVFLESARDLPIYDILSIKDHPDRPILKGVMNVISTSIFYKEVYELISFFYQNEKILMCEIEKQGTLYELRFIPANNKKE